MRQSQDNQVARLSKASPRKRTENIFGVPVGWSNKTPAAQVSCNVDGGLATPAVYPDSLNFQPVALPETSSPNGENDRTRLILGSCDRRETSSRVVESAVASPASFISRRARAQGQDWGPNREIVHQFAHRPARKPFVGLCKASRYGLADSQSAVLPIKTNKIGELCSSDRNVSANTVRNQQVVGSNPTGGSKKLPKIKRFL